MSCVVALRLSLPPSTRAQKAKISATVDPAQAIAVGEEADRAVFSKNPWRRVHYRPVGPAEFAALLQRCNGYPLPGVRIPRSYTFMGSFFSRNLGDGIIDRELYPCTKLTWNRMVLDLRCGQDVEELVRGDAEYRRKDCVLYTDEISAPAQCAGIA